jgi:hypothetical protein
VLAAALGLPPLRAAEPRCEFTNVSRVVAVGDVHGAVDRFTAILQTAGLIDDKSKWSGGTAHLVQLGDIVDRGPDSRKALDLLKRLEAEAARAGGAVHALIGNHEAARMLGDLRATTPEEVAAFATSDSQDLRERFIRAAKAEEREALAKDTPLGLLEMRLAFGREGAYGEWLRRHNAFVKINGVLFVHGGLSPAVALLPCEVVNRTLRRELDDDLEKTRAAPLASLLAREDGPLWYRGLAQVADTETAVIDDLFTKQRARAIVIGHTVTSNGRIRQRFGNRVFQIDTGMQPAYAQGGRASALEFVGDTVTAIYVDRRDALLPPRCGR